MSGHRPPAQLLNLNGWCRTVRLTRRVGVLQLCVREIRAGWRLTDAGRASRERIRLQAVERFEDGQKNMEIAAALRVSERSVERWRRAWRERGELAGAAEAGAGPDGASGA